MTYSRWKTGAEALANHLGMSLSEVRAYRYQPTRNKGVYAVGDSYYCAVSSLGGVAPKGWDWVRVEDDYALRHGYYIYKA